MYEYLAWVMLLGIVWTLFYAGKQNLRRKILWSSIVALPFGFGELYFIPNYWNPGTILDLGVKYSLDIEAFLLMFFLGGIAGAIYELITADYLPRKQKFCGTVCRCYLPLATTLAAFVILIKAFPGLNIIYPSVVACFAGSALALIIYPKLRSHILLGGVVFALLYGVSLAVIDFLFPGWIAAAWNIAGLSGLTLLAVPFEEMLFGFAFGMLWTPIYEETCSNLQMHSFKYK